MNKTFKLKQIGLIKTPYVNNAPYQPLDEDKGEFYIIVNKKYKEGLFDLEKFHYIYIIYYIHLLKNNVSMNVTPPWTKGKKVGVFASRSPLRPNPIGISIVKLKKIVDNKIIISGIDVFNDTPLLDIKPYIKDLDSKKDSNYGWLNGFKGNKDHLVLHIKGIPH